MNQLLFVVFAPIALGLAGLFLPNILKRLLGAGVLGYSLYLALHFFIRTPAAYVLGGNVLFELNDLRRTIVLFLALLGLLIFVYSLRGLPRQRAGKSLVLLLLTIGAAQGTAVSGHIVALIIFWGLTGLCLYFYALLNGPAAADAAKKAFLMAGGSDALLILGFAIVAQRNGGAFYLAGLRANLDGFWPYLAFFSLFLAALTKAGGFPLHTWVPAYCEAAPVEGAALLPAAFDKLLGIYLLAAIMTGIFTLPPAVRMVVMATGALTIVIGVMMALVQHNGRKLLGYHAVSQVGYMIVGLGTGTPLGTLGGLFHLVNNVLYKAGLFLSLGAVEKRTGTAELDRLGGLARSMPLTFLSTLVFALAISGLPPLNGFFSKWLIYQSLLAGARMQPPRFQGFFLLCLTAAVFGSGLTLASFLKFLYALYFGKRKEGSGALREIEAVNWLPTMILAGLCLFLGVFAYPVAVRYLLGPILGGVEIGAALPGFYQPYALVFLLATGLAACLLGYLACRRIRFDRNYVGGQEDSPSFTVDGTHFYDNVRDLSPLRVIYDLAERKRFDLYRWAGLLVQRTGALLQAVHTGVLPTYTVWTLGGFVLVVLIVSRR